MVTAGTIDIDRSNISTAYFLPEGGRERDCDDVVPADEVVTSKLNRASCRRRLKRAWPRAADDPHAAVQPSERCSAVTSKEIARATMREPSSHARGTSC